MSTTTSETDALRAVLIAAEALIAARENQMVTSDEWDALEHAVAECTQPPPATSGGQREETFSVEQNLLVRRVVPDPRRGKPYEHRCEKDSFEAVADAIEQFGTVAFTLEEVRQRADVPWTQAAVAIAFLKERSCIVPAHGRKHVVASSCVFEDAMIEWHALYEEPAEAAEEEV